MLACAALVAASIGLAACESTRALVATPGATPWPVGSHLRVTLMIARTFAGPTQPGRPNTLFIQASDSAAATDALPPEVASASTLALLAGGVAYPLSAGFGLPHASGATRSVPVMLTNPQSIGALMPRSDGTQEYHFLVDQRLVRTYTATVSIIP